MQQRVLCIFLEERRVCYGEIEDGSGRVLRSQRGRRLQGRGIIFLWLDDPSFIVFVMLPFLKGVASCSQSRQSGFCVQLQTKTVDKKESKSPTHDAQPY